MLGARAWDFCCLKSTSYFRRAPHFFLNFLFRFRFVEAAAISETRIHSLAIVKNTVVPDDAFHDRFLHDFLALRAMYRFCLSVLRMYGTHYFCYFICHPTIPNSCTVRSADACCGVKCWTFGAAEGSGPWKSSRRRSEPRRSRPRRRRRRRDSGCNRHKG